MCLIFLWAIPGKAYAGQVEIKVGKNQTGVVVDKNAAAETLFGGTDFFPGEEKTGTLYLKNGTGQKLYYRIGRPRKVSGSTLLLDTLRLNLTEEDGSKIYNGALGKADSAVRVIQPGKIMKVNCTLSMPGKTGNEAAGQEAVFLLTCRMADNRTDLEGDYWENGTGEGNGNSNENSGGNGSGENGNAGNNDGNNGGSGNNTGSGSNNGNNNGNNQGNGSNGGNNNTSGSGKPGHGSGSIGNGNQNNAAGSNQPGHTGAGGTGSSSEMGSNSSFAGSGYITVGNGTVSAGNAPGNTSVIYDNPDLSLKTGFHGGTWVLVDAEKQHWKYRLPDGTELNSGWAFLENPYASGKQTNYSWFYFDPNGWMGIGWIHGENDIWYHTGTISDGTLGQLTIGWLHDAEDGNIYYLDQQTGIMQTGWQTLQPEQKEGQNGQKQTYYFARMEDTYAQNWFYQTSFGRWIYDMLGNRTYGSLYRNETTPDGSYADETGAKR